MKYYVIEMCNLHDNWFYHSGPWTLSKAQEQVCNYNGKATEVENKHQIVYKVGLRKSMDIFEPMPEPVWEEQ